jgi:hypothetical protein
MKKNSLGALTTRTLTKSTQINELKQGILDFDSIILIPLEREDFLCR